MLTIKTYTSLLLACLIMVFPACEKSKQTQQTQFTDKSTDSHWLSTKTVDKPTDLSTAPAMKVRKSVLAGQWYANQPQVLNASIQKYLQEAPTQTLETDQIRAIIVPHAGHFWSGPTAAAAYRALNPKQYKRVFILCPNHRMPVQGAVAANADAFETPLGKLMVDSALIEKWEKQGLIQIHDAPHRQEHAIEIQLPFIQTVFQNQQPQIVPLIIGEISTANAQKLGNALREALQPDDLVIISTDLMHYGANYGYVPFGAPVQPQIREYDAQTIDAIAQLQSQTFENYARKMPHAACGLNPLRILTFAFENQGLTAKELAYDTSGRKSGDDDMSVSYVAMAIYPPKNGQSDPHDKPSPKQNADMNNSPVPQTAQKTAHALVRKALEAAVDEQNTTPFPQNIDFGADNEVFQQAYGVFVTLNDAKGHLRGCIGNILPVAKLAESLWGRAQDAALNDPRFDPVTPEELDHLHVEISVLTTPTPIQGPEDIIIGKHGIIFKKGPWSSVFLPQVAPEQGWNVEQTLSALARKAGLSPNAWKEGATFAVFEAQVF